VIILLALVPVIIFVGILIVVWSRLRSRGFFTGEQKPEFPLRLRYILGPLVLLVVYIIIAAVFYHMLPTEQVAYHFLTDGTPDAYGIRLAVVGIGLAIQVVLVLISLGIVFGISRSGFLSNQDGAVVKAETILTFMGNVLVLPQLILLFAMCDIFSYNSYQVHPLPVWLFAVIILAIATIGFFFLLVSYALRVNRQNKS
jgi:uncharacterized membrane protein